MQPDRSASLKQLIFTKDVVLLLLIGIAFLAFSIVRRDEVFPNASIDLRITRNQAVSRAKDYAAIAGFKLPNKTTSSRYFSSDDDASTFLEYEYPLSQANELMKSEIPVWYWTVHLLGDDQEEFTVNIGTNGSVRAFKVDIANDKKVSSIAHDSARDEVMAFVRHELHIPLDAWKLVNDQETNLPNRVDHTFTWENQSKDYKGAHLQVKATVSGNKITNFKYYLKTPDTFDQKFEWLRAQNRALADVPFIVIIIAALSLPVIFLRNWTKGKLRLRFAVICGVIAASISFLTHLTSIATVMVSTSNWSMENFLAKRMINNLSESLLTGLLCVIFFGAIEVIYRYWYTKQVSMELLIEPTSKAFRSISVAKSAILGFAVFGISIGYQILFFLVAKKYGVWAPLSMHERSVMNSFSPTLDAISLGLTAATLEEFGFRVFLLAVIQKGTGSFWAANFLQAVVWGFGHCNYAVEPPYTRGIELGIMGIFYGWIMRRYGVLALLIGHYAFDAYLSVLPLFNLRAPTEILHAFLAMAPLAILPGIALYKIKKSGLVPDSDVSNEKIIASLSAPQESKNQQTVWCNYNPIPRNKLFYSFITLCVAALLLAIPRKRIGDEPVLTVDRDQVIGIARAKLKKENYNVGDFQVCAWLSDDTDHDQLQYMYNHTKFEHAKRLEHLIEPRLNWNVRFFKPGQANTFYARLSPNGDPVTETISIDEFAAGAKLTPEEAYTIATSYLDSISTPESGKFIVFDKTKLEHPNRTDWIFIAENPSARVGEARFQVYLRVVGNTVCDVRRYWSLPGKEHFHRGVVTETEILANLGKLLCALIIVPNLGYWAFCACKKQTPNKYVVSILVLTTLVLSLLDQLNRDLTTAYWSYIPTEPVDAHLLRVAISSLMRVATDVSVAALLGAIVSSTHTGMFVSNSLRDLTASAMPRLKSFRMWADAVFIGLVAAIVFAGLMSVNEFMNSALSLTVPLTRVKHTAGLEQTSVYLASLTNALKYGLCAMLVASVLIKWNEFYAHSQDGGKPGEKGFQWLVPILITTSLCFAGFDATDASKSVFNIVTYIAISCALYLVIAELGNRNILACFFGVFFLIIASDAIAVTKHSQLIHSLDLTLLWLTFAAPFVVVTAWFVLRKLWSRQ